MTPIVNTTQSRQHIDRREINGQCKWVTTDTDELAGDGLFRNTGRPADARVRETREGGTGTERVCPLRCRQQEMEMNIQ